MRENFIELEGIFLEKRLEGRNIDIYSFVTVDNGVLEVGIHIGKDKPKLNVMYKVTGKLRGVVREKENFTYIRNHFNIYSLEEVESEGN